MKRDSWKKVREALDAALYALKHPESNVTFAEDACLESLHILDEEAARVAALTEELEAWRLGLRDRNPEYLERCYSKSFAAKAVFFRKRACDAHAQIDVLNDTIAALTVERDRLREAVDAMNEWRDVQTEAWHKLETKLAALAAKEMP